MRSWHIQIYAVWGQPWPRFSCEATRSQLPTSVIAAPIRFAVAAFLRQTIDHVLYDAKGRGLVVKGIGIDSNPDVVAWDVQREDVFLLTGGVHEVVAEAELVELCVASTESSRTASALLELASSRGATDYLTALIFRPARNQARPT